MRGQSQTLASRACARLSVALLANALIKAQHAFVRVPRGADSHPSACAATPVSLPLPRGLEAFIATNTDETTFLQKHAWGGAAGELDLDAKTATEVSIYICIYNAVVAAIVAVAVVVAVAAVVCCRSRYGLESMPADG